MGRGSSGMKKGGLAKTKDFPEAFAAGKDFRAIGGVDHDTRTVSRTTQREWDQYVAGMQNGVTAADEDAIMRQYSSRPNADGAYVTGYVRTQNSFAINRALYDPANDGKSVDKIFKRKADRDTVKALDKAISNNTTQSDGSYTRFSGFDAIKATYGLSDSEMTLLASAPNMTPSQLSKLSASMAGSRGSSKAYTSASANRSLNAFSNPNAKQSKGFIFERKLSVPKGTKAWAPRKNAQESEVIFGRGLKTVVTGISLAKDGHIVIHEAYDGYM